MEDVYFKFYMKEIDKSSANLLLDQIIQSYIEFLILDQNDTQFCLTYILIHESNLNTKSNIF